MKKTYITPQTWAVTLQAREIIAASKNMVVDSNTSNGLDSEDDFLSRHRGWGSDNWAEDGGFDD